jgi:hypothetical protein
MLVDRPPTEQPASGEVRAPIAESWSRSLSAVHPLSLALAVTVASAMEHSLADELREQDARLRRRYGDLTRASTDLLVSNDGRPLAATASWAPPGRLSIPSGGGEIELADGSAVVAEPLGGGEAYLVRWARRRPGDSWRVATLRLWALGRDRVTVQVGAGRQTLSPRHSEVVVLLSEHADGLTAEELAVGLYGDRAKPVSARAVVSRLRTLVGARIEAEPYRLQPPVESDIAVLRRFLRQGQAAEAAVLHGDGLLPRSEAPAVVELRDELEGWTRSTAMTADDPDALWIWLSSAAGQRDLQGWVRFLSIVPYGDGRRALAAAQLKRIRHRLALSGNSH